ncbi:hypothetical protein [Billgrantia montanilacus]|uniref:Uncharacterized protein n=1 Tax=Billgrantia montanilacus TaxID=2282305 RepID=A0A368TSR7_9GAMM|nr:hypothetical protein [Halomonas montanilacus]RCV87819.1 hypothetical protein DU505_16025 [Halomonas montanilacus]
MLTTDSMSLLWLTYLGLSLVILVTGYLGLAFLPRLLRLPLTWAVAGILWVPTRFRLPLVEEDEFYTGMAPAVVVATVAFLERNATAMMSSALLVVAGAGLGIAVGLLQWWMLRPTDDEMHIDDDDNNGRDGRDGGQSREPRERREPMIG